MSVFVQGKLLVLPYSVRVLTQPNSLACLDNLLV